MSNTPGSQATKPQGEAREYPLQSEKALRPGGRASGRVGGSIRVRRAGVKAEA